jgi:hypothetical protein
MKTYSRNLATSLFIASFAMILITCISPVMGQNQNQRLHEILQDRERETIQITAKLFGDIQFDADENSNVFFMMRDGRVIVMGKESGNLSADEIASVYIYRPNRSKDLFIEITGPSEDSKTETSTQGLPAGRILYIVDGMELLEKHVKNIPPTDIVNITVLKNDSAVEQYGKKAEEYDGVILIETRRAKLLD